MAGQGFRHVEAAVLSLPFVERRARYALPAAHIRRCRPGLLLLQNADDLLFTEPAALLSSVL